MVNILQSSGLLPWTKEMLETVPDVCGVYLLCDRLRLVQYVGKAGVGRLRERLKEHHAAGDVRSVSLFQWHRVLSDQDALELERQLISHYAPPQNQRPGG